MATRSSHIVLGCAALVASAALLASGADRPQATPAGLPPALPATPERTGLAYQGAGSCSSVACHGGDARLSIKGSEHTIWISRDRHSRAQSVLSDARSRQIARNLGGALADSPETNRLCLNCHATPVLEPAGAMAQCAPRDGVGCESCHGPAQRWLAEHTTDLWRTYSDAEKTAFGMRTTKDLAVRARLCAECHVGAPGRDVNHDLIAAGHPALRFELSAFLAQAPKHWRESDDRARHPDLQARLWALGQVANAQAELNLLQHRAAAVADTAPDRAGWPEFAEYDCFACHHALAEPNLRPRPGSSGKLGTPAWATWYFPLPQALAGSGDIALDGPIQTLNALMRRPMPPAAEVAAQAGAAASAIEVVLARVQSDPIDAAWLAKQIAALRGAPPPPSWDRSAQLYLALAALYHAQGDLDPAARDPKLRDELEAMRATLTFPVSFNSPAAGPLAPR